MIKTSKLNELQKKDFNNLSKKTNRKYKKNNI